MYVLYLVYGCMLASSDAEYMSGERGWADEGYTLYLILMTRHVTSFQYAAPA